MSKSAVSPAVTVIVPCYRVTEFIAELLDSLRAQTFRDFDVILINDGCPDTVNLERVIAPYRNEIEYIRQENQGVSAARNAAIRRARAPLIALLDGDDSWAPQYLESQVRFFHAHPELDVVYPNAVFVNGVWSGKRFMDMMPSTEPTFQAILSRKCAIFGGLTARRDAVLRAGLFDTTLPAAEDLDLWLRMAKLGSRFAPNPEVLYRYRQRPGNISQDPVAIATAAIHVCEKFWEWPDLTKEERAALQSVVENRKAHRDLSAGHKALYAGDRAQSLKLLRSANRVLNNRKVRVALLLLEICPGLLFRVLRRRYPTEHSFLHGETA